MPGAKVNLHTCLTRTLAGDEWTASRTGHVSPGKEPSLRSGYGTGLSPDLDRKLRTRENSLPLILLSSSSYWAPVANAPNVLQPYWFIVLPLDVLDLTASLLL